MAETRPLLKGFGKLANVAEQIATDKAVNSRRERQGAFARFDITQGQLLEAVISDSATKAIPHALGRVPKGAVILMADQDCRVESVNASRVFLNVGGATVTLWVV